MSIRIVAVHLSGGFTHQHITWLWWADPTDGSSGNNSRAAIVDWIEGQNGRAYVADPYGDVADVGVVAPSSGPKYLRTHADGVWTDNLLALPRR
ncbi:DUF3892 domain-containing protein [Mycobacterium colombiense]